MNTSVNKFNSIFVDSVNEKGADIENYIGIEEPLFTGVANNVRALEGVVQNSSFFVSRRYDPIKFSNAVRAICNEYGLQTHDVEGPLLYLYVFGVDTLKLSTEAIINLWDCHCNVYASNDFEYADDFDAA